MYRGAGSNRAISLAPPLPMSAACLLVLSLLLARSVSHWCSGAPSPLIPKASHRVALELSRSRHHRQDRNVWTGTAPVLRFVYQSNHSYIVVGSLCQKWSALGIVLILWLRCIIAIDCLYKCGIAVKLVRNYPTKCIGWNLFESTKRTMYMMISININNLSDNHKYLIYR